jgi:hypothetical protein
MTDVLEAGDYAAADRKLWDVRETGDWGRDNRSGAERADALIQGMREGALSATVLGHTVREMVDSGVDNGAAVGFFHRIAEHLIVGT